MVPARRKSKAMKRARRSHHALRPIGLAACPRCGVARRPHRACANCGYVNPRTALPIKSKES